MAEPTPEEPKYTESQFLAVTADRVARETAELTTAKTELETQLVDAKTKLDVETAARTAAEQARDEAKSEFEAFKTGLEKEREAASLKDGRIAQVKEAAPHMGEDFLTDEERVTRITAMDEAQFAGYLTDLKATAGKAPATPAGAPRETAMSGEQVKPTGATAAAGFLGRRVGALVAVHEQKGA